MSYSDRYSEKVFYDSFCLLIASAIIFLYVQNIFFFFAASSANRRIINPHSVQVFYQGTVT